MNCAQCLDNLRVDGLQPECDGCRYRQISKENLLALALYDISCPWGELDGGLLQTALAEAGIKGGGRRQVFIRKIIAVHRQIKEHYANAERTEQ